MSVKVFIDGKEGTTGLKIFERFDKRSDLEIIEIPAHTYAVFTCKGKMPEAFKETYKRICTEFFPQSSEYRYGNGIELEVYPSDDVTNPDYTCEIWIAVEKKN